MEINVKVYFDLRCESKVALNARMQLVTFSKLWALAKFWHSVQGNRVLMCQCIRLERLWIWTRQTRRCTVRRASWPHGAPCLMLAAFWNNQSNKSYVLVS